MLAAEDAGTSLVYGRYNAVGAGAGALGALAASLAGLGHPAGGVQAWLFAILIPIGLIGAILAARLSRHVEAEPTGRTDRRTPLDAVRGRSGLGPSRRVVGRRLPCSRRQIETCSSRARQATTDQEFSGSSPAERAPSSEVSGLYDVLCGLGGDLRPRKWASSRTALQPASPVHGGHRGSGCWRTGTLVPDGPSIVVAPQTGTSEEATIRKSRTSEPTPEV